MRILRSLALGSFIVLASASGRSQPVTNGTVVATVQGDFEVTVANLMTRSERIFYRGVLELILSYHLIFAYFKYRCAPKIVSPEARKEFI